MGVEFTVLHSFKDASGNYETGNTHNTDVCGLDPARLPTMQKQGLVHLEGEEDQPLATTPQVIQPDNVENRATAGR